MANSLVMSLSLQIRLKALNMTWLWPWLLLGLVTASTGQNVSSVPKNEFAEAVKQRFPERVCVTETDEKPGWWCKSVVLGNNCYEQDSVCEGSIPDCDDDSDEEEGCKLYPGKKSRTALAKQPLY